MADVAAALVPALIVFGAAAILAVVAIWAFRRARRSPRARATADAARAAAGSALVQLDDAVSELDLEVGLSGALYGGETHGSLRRARMTAQHVRDREFSEFRDLVVDDIAPFELERGAKRIRSRVVAALEVVERARAENAEWTRANVTAAMQVDALRARLADLRASMGDPDALVRELSARFDASEWEEASRAARSAVAKVAEAESLLDSASRSAADPTRTALPDLAAAERSLRTAHAAARTLEETHRLVTQAAQALPGEFDVARNAVRQALTNREALEPADGDRLTAETRVVAESLDELERDAARRPTWTVDRIARLRDRLDLALGDARTAQQRLRGARTALPGTLAAARGAVAHAEASFGRGRVGADARVRLAAAENELAAARQAHDPVAALDSARRAIRHAEDAKALADYDRLNG